MIYDKLKWLFSYLPILLFIVIVLHHYYLVRFENLSPWLGGGYGMFSTTDYGPSRYIKAYGLKDNIIKEEIKIPLKHSKVARKLRSLPSTSNLQDLALDIDDYLKSTQHSYPHIRIEVWSSHYDKKSLIPTFNLLNVINHKPI